MKDAYHTKNMPGTGLTTKDLADTDPAPRPGASPPTYPGEATAVPEDKDAAPGEHPRTPEAAPAAEREHPLIDPEDAQSYRERWERVQGAFVDDPKEAVRSADALVAEVIKSLAGTFAAHKGELEGQWSRGEEVETEGLRVALQRYRTFFNRLLQT
jgi:hypothetical protein